VSRLELAGRTAVVTGAGRGIGRAVARGLAEAGAAVVVAARTGREIEAVAAELSGEGHRALAVRCDVTDPASVERLAEEASRLADDASRSADGAGRLADGAGGTVDILVNNAGAAHSAPVHKTELEDWNRMLAVNATGAFLCTRALLPGMMERGWGRIVNVASVAGLTGARYISAYAASKHAAIGLTRCTAAETAARGVTVNAVCPGYVDTPMTTESLRRIAEKTGRSAEEALQAILAGTPQKRLIQPAEVAHAVLSLCHEEARGINGDSIVIDGGELLA
jgi:NAD(P)-dependent dehydrogenase (short-subunit alcohol dehydrogenase family)